MLVEQLGVAAPGGVVPPLDAVALGQAEDYLVVRQLTRQPMFLDCGIRDGLDVYKSMALGATAVSVGTTLIQALKEGKEAGAAKQIELMTKQLQRMMTVTGVKDVKNFDATVIHRRDW